MIPVHVPVLAAQVLDRLAPPPGGALVVDCTLGEGGHAEAFLKADPDCRVIGIDADPAMRERAAERLATWGGRVEVMAGWSDEALAGWSGPPADRILMDLGISTYHYEGGGRGFSFARDESLDMRLDPSSGPSAADLVNSLGETELADLIYGFGEERYSRRIAALVARERKSAPFRDAARLADAVRRAVPPQARHGRLHPATRTFQALRIAVNRELERLDAFLEAAPGVLAPGGRLGVISFHSLEDRRVKLSFRERASAGDGAWRLVDKKPLTADEAERRDNPPSRSAKFRVLERVGGTA